MEEAVQDSTVDVKQIDSRRKLLRNGCIVFVAVLVGYLHYRYVSALHENYYHFSHLSELERELTLRTEMGFYYSYYKTVVEERPFLAAISKLMYDRLVEYPNEVNAFNRFNIHPEVALGALYRCLEPWLAARGPQCRAVWRGAGRAPVTACAGLGVPVYFYLEAVWVLAGLLLALVFLYGTTLSGSALGGLLAAAGYMANHALATRVQRAPNERENLAAPLLLLQAWLLAVRLRGRGGAGLPLQVAMFVVNCLCLVCWQFSQFVFLAQTAILFVMEQLGIVDLKTLCVFLHAHFCGLHMAVLLLQGNDMLKSSLYTSFFLAVSAYCLFFSSFRIKVKTKFDLFVESWLVLLRICIVTCASVYLKLLIGELVGAEADGHVWELLRCKLGGRASFHTRMYTCIDAFDFLPASYLLGVTRTLLLPLALYSCAYYCLAWLSKANCDTIKHFHQKTKGHSFKEEPQKEEKDSDKKDTSETERETDSDDSGIENRSERAPGRGEPSRPGSEELRAQPAQAQAQEAESALVHGCRALAGGVDAAVFCAASQLAVCAALAGLFMRLQVLLTPQLCVVSALAVNTNMALSFQPRVSRLVFWSLALAVIARELVGNVSRELAFQGEFSDWETEELVQWARSAPRGVFAGSLPAAAAVLLSARRAIVAHPHYEHKGARARALAVHKVYGRFSAQHVYEELARLHASYLVVESRLCFGRTTQGCTILDVWDAEAPALALAGRPQLCRALLAAGGADHLYRVFANDHYAVFRVHDLSVRYMPRVFDT